jgi:hypothetical protein
MHKIFSLKSIPLAATLAGAMVLGSAVHAQGAGSSGAGKNAVETGASPAPGTTGAEAGSSKSATPSATGAKKAKDKPHAKPARMNKSATTTQPTPPAGPKEDPARIKP